MYYFRSCLSINIIAYIRHEKHDAFRSKKNTLIMDFPMYGARKASPVIANPLTQTMNKDFCAISREKW